MLPLFFLLQFHDIRVYRQRHLGLGTCQLIKLQAFCNYRLALVIDFGQVAMFWPRLSPFKATRGAMAGVVVGIALWAVLFLPLAVFGIHSRLDTFSVSAPNQSVSLIASHFQGLQYLIIGGSFLFHLVYGALMGLIAGMLYEVRQKRNVRKIER